MHSKMPKFLSLKGEQGKAKPFTNSNRNDLTKPRRPNTPSLQTDRAVRGRRGVLAPIPSPPKGLSPKWKLKLRFFSELACFRRKENHSEGLTLKTKTYGLNNAIALVIT